MTAMRSDAPSKQIQLHPEFLAAVQDAETYEAAIACAKGQGWPAATVINADISQVIQSLGRGRPPAIILVDLDNTSDAGAKVSQLVKQCGGKSQILAVGSANDVSFYRAVTQAGAADYLVKPLNSIILRDSITPLLAAKNNNDRSPGSKEKKSGHLYVVIGARGGVGATTIAVNVSWIMAHEFDQKVAMVDLDLQFGNSALALDLEPGRGLREVLNSPDRMDSLLINSSMSKESDNLSVFNCEESIEEMVEFDTGGAIALVKELRQTYDHIVVDMPRHLIGRHRRLLSTADHIVLVSDLTLAGIRDTTRIMSAIQNLGVAAPIHIVAARVGDGDAQVNRATFERGIRAKVEALIPHDPKTVKLSANRGKAVAAVARNTPLAERLSGLAQLVTGLQVEGGTSGGGGLFSFLKRG